MGWTGYEPGQVEVREADEHCPKEVWIGLNRKASRYRSSGCGKLCARYHDAEEHEIRDFSILGVALRLFLGRFRVACPRYGHRLKALDWLEPRSRVTRRVAEDVARPCRVLSIQREPPALDPQRRLQRGREPNPGGQWAGVQGDPSSYRPQPPAPGSCPCGEQHEIGRASCRERV